ncbi:MAG: 50S ribosomal protein L23 [Candidatus Nealsonbacteria bacterium]|nr:50S ribosomal protein L23 [Candidatus Nealsonbacteria bacterium]
MVFEGIFKKKKYGKTETARPLSKEEKKPRGEPALPAEKPRSASLKAQGIESGLVLTAPHVTEKATQLAGENQYVFKVFAPANKIEIKKAIESLYNVKVQAVRIINVPAKQRKRGRTQGWKKGYKKALIQIKEGQKIEAATV